APLEQSTASVGNVYGPAATITDSNGTWTRFVNSAGGFGVGAATFSGTVTAGHTFTTSGGASATFAFVNAGGIDNSSNNTCASATNCATATYSTAQNNDSIFDAWSVAANSSAIFSIPTFSGDALGNAGIIAQGLRYLATAGTVGAKFLDQASAGTGSIGDISFEVKPAVQPSAISQSYPTVNDSTHANTGTGSSTLTISAPTGSANDLLLAPLYVA